MSRAKDYLDLVDQRGWTDIGKQICSVCVTEPVLVRALLDEGGLDCCDYCKLVPSGLVRSGPIEIILELVVNGLRYEYEDPAHQVMYVTADGGYQEPVDDTWDLLVDLEVADSDAVLTDLSMAIEQAQWCQRDPYALTPRQALESGWTTFREYVKSNRRFTFLVENNQDDGAGSIPMHAVPAAVAEAVLKGSLLTLVEPGQEWWRARVHSPGEHFTTAGELGAPPSRFARDNRMSPKGISAFYGASTAAGARAEVAGYAQPEQEATIGRFTVERQLTVVDLRTVPEVPSLFDDDFRHLRAPLSFLQGFVSDVTRIADPSDDQNLDYVPTQIVAEYIRQVIFGPSAPVEGLLWSSTKDPSVTVCVLFEDTDINSRTREPQSALLLAPESVFHVPAPL